MSLAHPAVVKGKDFWTGPRRFFAQKYTGRRPGRLPGGHIADLADLRKGIILCRDCVPKFNSSRSGYVYKPDMPTVRGDCDGCKEFTVNGRFLVHHSLANLVG